MPKPIDIDLEKIVLDPQYAEFEWGNKEVISKVFSVNPSTVTKWIADMRDNPKFRGYVINPTHRIVLISKVGFLEYAIWLQDNRYRR